MYKLGITGGLGSGKSTAAQYLIRRGIPVIDADLVAKNQLETSGVLQAELLQEFGLSIFKSKGGMNYSALAAIAFSSPEKQQRLNQIVWPHVRERMGLFFNDCQIGGKPLAAIDAALLLEAGFKNDLDGILLITAGKALRIERAMARGNLTLEQVQARMALQMPETEKRKLADYIIENKLGKAQLEKALDSICQIILQEKSCLGNK